jgi:branched-chain amino acid transport system permease protein
MQAHLGRRPTIVFALVGAIAAAVGSFGPWASYSFGYAGSISVGGSPGGARVFTFILLVFAPLILIDVPARRRAGLAASIGIVGIAGGNLIAIIREGGNISASGWGAWATLAGGLALFIAFLALPQDRDVDWSYRPIPTLLEVLIVLGVIGAVLELLVWGLKINESSRFVSYLSFVLAGSVALQRLGIFMWAQQVLSRHRMIGVLAAAAAAAVFPFTQNGNAYWIRVFASIGVFATAAIGLNVVVGLAGLLDLGYVAFFGVGAYVSGLLANANLTTVHVHLPFILVMPIGAGVAALFGLVIGAPTLRLRGDYLAIVTLGFGEIFRLTANNWDGLTRGPNGVSGIADLRFGSFSFGRDHHLFGVLLPGFSNYYFLELVLLAFVITVFIRLNQSRIGRAWIAIREDETAAAAMGVNTIRLKLLAFAIGAFVAGLAGTVNAHVTTQVSPDSYTFLESILLVAAVVLGGMGTVPGALLGSSLLFIIPEKLRSFQDKRLLLFGIALIVMMRFRPEGLVPSRRRQRELHDEETDSALGAPPGGPVAGP